MLRKEVRVYPASESLGSELTSALTRLLPVQFRSCAELDECSAGDAVISLFGDIQVLSELSQRRLHFLHVRSSSTTARSEAQGSPVQFGESPHLEKMLRGRRVPHMAVSDLRAECAEANEEVLASYGSIPVWVRRTTGDWSGNIVSAPLPTFAGAETPFDYLNGYHFIQLLPLLHFLREVTTDMGWTRPPLRACFMFDDPNLHWPSYGCLSFPKVLKRARNDRFHVAFATVPLDAWSPNSRAVRLFRENPKQLSLLIHGNDHTRKELGQPRSDDDYLHLLAQSLRRIERFERQTGLNVDRVMVPPHEALTNGAIAALTALGFEGVSLTRWSLRFWLEKLDWPSWFGLEIAEMADGSLPVLARYKLSEACDGPIVISAFLGQPIVLVEHHEAMASGLDLLSRAAETINSLGEVQWCSPGTMLRSNFLTRSENATLCVKPFSRRFELKAPQEIDSVLLPASHGTDEQACADEFTMIRQGRESESSGLPLQFDVPCAVAIGECIELVAVNLRTVDYRRLETPHFLPWALLRRILCEARDRLVALKPRPHRA